MSCLKRLYSQLRSIRTPGNPDKYHCPFSNKVDAFHFDQSGLRGIRTVLTGYHNKPLFLPHRYRLGWEGDPTVPGIVDQPRSDDGGTQWKWKEYGMEGSVEGTRKVGRRRRRLLRHRPQSYQQSETLSFIILAVWDVLLKCGSSTTSKIEFIWTSWQP